MRNNIILVCAALQAAARRFPEQRASQLMFNALDARGMARLDDGSPRDIFYVEDRDLTAALLEFAAQQ